MKLKKILIVAQSSRPQVAEALTTLTHELSRREIEFCVVEPAWYKLKNAEVISDFDIHYRHEDYQAIFVIGGDGTFLYAARTFGIFGIPLVGINAGKLGFLMSVSPQECGSLIDGIENESIPLCERFLLDVCITRDNRTHRLAPFLNDAVIARGTLSRMNPIEVFIENELFSHYSADGLIISTPTGSTAYNLSAGGPILSPTLPAIVITPICAHTLAVRPFVTDAHHHIKVRINGDPQESALTIDGQENFHLQEGDEIHVQLSEKKLTVYEPHKHQFYQLLRKKLRWQV
jgi:NAD+ kinase